MTKAKPKKSRKKLVILDILRTCPVCKKTFTWRETKRKQKHCSLNCSKKAPNSGRKLFDGKDEDGVVNKLEQAFAIDATVGEACFYADISVKVYYNWIKGRPGLSERFTALRNKPVLTARQTVANAIQNDSDLALKYLERKRKDEFSTKSILTGEVLTGEMTQNHKKRVEQILRENGELKEEKKKK